MQLPWLQHGPVQKKFGAILKLPPDPPDPEWHLLGPRTLKVQCQHGRHEDFQQHLGRSLRPSQKSELSKHTKLNTHTDKFLKPKMREQFQACRGIWPPFRIELCQEVSMNLACHLLAKKRWRPPKDDGQNPLQCSKTKWGKTKNSTRRPKTCCMCSMA